MASPVSAPSDHFDLLITDEEIAVLDKYFPQHGEAAEATTAAAQQQQQM